VRVFFNALLFYLIFCLSLGPTIGWLRGFLKRHPILTNRKPEPVTKAAATVNKKNIDIWFDNIIKFINDNNMQELFSRPEAWFNADESGFALNVSFPKVFTTKNIRHTYRVESTKHHQQVTVTVCASADGTYLPAQVIFKKSFSRMEEVGFAARGNDKK
jgi:hypothetical protein